MTEQPITPDASEIEANRRECGRINPYWLNSDQGYVLDISETGIRLLAKRILKGRITLPIWTDSVGLHVMADVVWSKKIGFRQYEVGLRFVDLNDDDMQRLREIALEYEKKSMAGNGLVEGLGASPDEDAPVDDPRLDLLIDAWTVLPDAVKAGIVAMANAARDRAA